MSIIVNKTFNDRTIILSSIGHIIGTETKMSQAGKDNRARLKGDKRTNSRRAAARQVPVNLQITALTHGVKSRRQVSKILG